MSRTVVVVGLGNIGSQLVPLLARMPDVGRIVLIDQDKYDDTNIATQAITPGAVGRSKTQVQGLRLRKINPSIEVTNFFAPVESLPLGRLRADAILACVDNRVARQYLNQTARHLGVTLIDAGVQADSSLARVSVFRSAPDCACLECNWDQADYEAIEQNFACQPGGRAPSPTNAPAQLGALAAAVQAIEVQRLFAGETDMTLGSHEIVLDAASHRQFVTTLKRRDTCRLADHDAWVLHKVRGAPEDITLAQVLAFRGPADSEHAVSLRAATSPFVTGLTCLGCGTTVPTLRLRSRLAERERTCKLCHSRQEAIGPDIVDWLNGYDLASDTGARSLRNVGFEVGDIFVLRRGPFSRYYELADPPARPRPAAGGAA